MGINITNIQRFSLHDGPGIRTTLFLKGCTLRCPWCANPENLLPQQQKYIKNGVMGIYGKEMSVDEIFDEILKDKVFYEDGGGVTFSGGEALAQQKELEPLWKKLQKGKINIAVETALFVPNITIALSYIDLFIVDIKILDVRKCKEVEKGDIFMYLKNFDILLESGKPVILRLPIIGGYTDTKSNQRDVVEFLKHKIDKGNIQKIEMIKEHSLGLDKYISLRCADPCFPIPDYKGTDDCLIENYKAKLVAAIDAKVPVEICNI